MWTASSSQSGPGWAHNQGLVPEDQRLLHFLFPRMASLLLPCGGKRQTARPVGEGPGKDGGLLGSPAAAVPSTASAKVTSQVSDLTWPGTQGCYLSVFSRRCLECPSSLGLTPRALGLNLSLTSCKSGPTSKSCSVPPPSSRSVAFITLAGTARYLPASPTKHELREGGVLAIQDPSQHRRGVQLK